MFNRLNSLGEYEIIPVESSYFFRLNRKSIPILVVIVQIVEFLIG